MVDSDYMVRLKTKMCSNKSTYRNKEKAEKVAAQWNQKVYECPICFCFHLTSKEDWRNEFVDANEFRREMARLECQIREELNKKIKALNVRVAELEKENRELKIQKEALIKSGGKS